MDVFLAILRVDEYSAIAPPLVPILLMNDTLPELRVTVLAYAVRAVSCLLANVVLPVMVMMLYAVITIGQSSPDIAIVFLNGYVRQSIISSKLFTSVVIALLVSGPPLTDFMTTVDMLTNNSLGELHPQPAENVSVFIETCLISVNHTLKQTKTPAGLSIPSISNFSSPLIIGMLS